ncbi:hypothetical protein GOBAR_DD04656 [Gossypium barbadense]|nr:hypothetical protein GOBAR_DD04656 [Gossypium barbadense]
MYVTYSVKSSKSKIVRFNEPKWTIPCVLVWTTGSMMPVLLATSANHSFLKGLQWQHSLQPLSSIEGGIKDGFAKGKDLVVSVMSAMGEE